MNTTTTKKHFISLADAIRHHNHITPEQDHFTPAQIETLAGFCLDNNENFNRTRWLGYIAGTNGKNGGKV